MLGPMRCLLIEDERPLALATAEALRDAGWVVELAHDGRTGLEMALTATFDVVVVDIMLPSLNGYDVLKGIRTQGAHPPVLMLTAKDGEYDETDAFDLGADDYVTKPFSPRELMARVRMILRRHSKPDLSTPGEAQSTDADLRVDLAKRRITAHGRTLDLSRYEYGVLALLLRQPGRVFTRTDLLEQVWDDPGESLDRTVDAHIKTLRAKLREVPELPDCIKTLRGIGYAFDDTQGLRIAIA